MSTRAISAQLPTDVVYVSGTVNGTAYTWTLVDTAWQATVDRAADEIYAVSLTAVTALGVSANYEFTLFYGLLSLITDRTQADVDRVRQLAQKGFGNMTEEEKTEWLNGLKGAYNAVDLNRVGNAVNYLSGRLTQLPENMRAYLESKGVAPDALFAIPYDPALYEVQAKITWQITDIPMESEMAEYLSNVVLICGAFDYKTDPLPESMHHLTYEGANAIEKALLGLDGEITAWKADTEKLIDNTAAAWFYSGDVQSAEI